MTVLWFVDRFGLPGQYHRVWVKLLRDNYVPTSEVRVISLHQVMKPRQLLTKYATRKAPTWIPDEGPAITRTIDALIAQMKPRAVVLAAPESLACLGLHPEHATLHALRGSVYWRSGVPHIVMLPMSAWFSLVSQKEIGAANYGFESQDEFLAGQQGSLPAQGGSSSGSFDSARNPTLRLPEGLRTDGSEAGQSTVGGTADSKSELLQARSPSGDRSERFRGLSMVREGAGTDSTELHGRDMQSADGGSSGDGQTSATDSESPADGNDVRGGAGGSALPAGEAGRSSRVDLGSDVGSHSLQASVGGLESGLRDDPEDDDGNDEDGVSSDDSPGTDDGDVDQFFYEPVLSPVGRFVLTADTQKLFRILRDGKNAGGPSRPIEVNWR